MYKYIVLELSSKRKVAKRFSFFLSEKKYQGVE